MCVFRWAAQNVFAGFVSFQKRCLLTLLDKIHPACHSLLESDLENHQAQLSRFQLHVTSVTEDIVSMEKKLNSTIMTLKKTLVSELHSCRMCTRTLFNYNAVWLIHFHLFPSCSCFLSAYLNALCGRKI